MLKTAISDEPISNNIFQQTRPYVVEIKNGSFPKQQCIFGQRGEYRAPTGSMAGMAGRPYSWTYVRVHLQQ